MIPEEKAPLVAGFSVESVKYHLGGTFRGDYYSLTEQATAKVNNLIYPVPDPRFPFRKFRQSLLVPFHLLQDRRIDRTKGNIIRGKRKRAVKTASATKRNVKRKTK